MGNHGGVFLAVEASLRRDLSRASNTPADRRSAGFAFATAALSAEPPAPARTGIRRHPAAGGVGVVPIIVPPFKARAIPWIIPPHLCRRIRRAPSGAISQTVIVPLVVRRVSRCLLLLLLHASLRLHALVGIVSRLTLAVHRQPVALIVPIAIRHLRVAVVAGGVMPVVLDLPLLRIRLSVLLPAFKRHAIDLRSLVPHVLPVRIRVRIRAVLAIRRIDTLGEKQRQGQQSEKRKFHDGPTEA